MTEPTSPSAAAPVVSEVLASVVDDFAARHPHLGDPDDSRDLCVAASDAFVEQCQSVGVDASVITGARLGEVPQFPGVRLILNAHSAVRVSTAAGEVVYDWTARQFDPAADFPLVASVADWRTMWTHPQNW